MALPAFGTNTTFDTLAASIQSVAQFEERRAWDAVSSYLTEFNRQLNEITSNIVDTTTDRLRLYGTVSQFKMQRVDQMGTPQAQKFSTGSLVGFPFEGFGIAVQYNRKYLQKVTGKQFAAQTTAVATASATNLIGYIKVALFSPLNYLFTDDLNDNVSQQFALPVKSLVNADGQPIPPGPYNVTFNPATHTHYLASATLTDAWLVGLVETVLEHNNTGSAILWISRTDAAAVAGLASFKAMVFDSTIKSANTEYGVGSKDPTNLNNIQIGWFRGVAVWIKPFMPASYYVCFMTGGQEQHPLVKRIRGVETDGTGAPAEGAGDLVLEFEDEEHPLRAKAWGQEFGIGVWNRTSAAVGYVGGTTYLIPDPTTFF